MSNQKSNKKGKSPSLHRSKSGNPYYGETESRQALLKRGMEYIINMSDDEYAQLHSKSGSLHFIRLLGLASKRKDRSMAGYRFNDANQDRYRDGFTTVGITLMSDEDISVPVIDMEIIKKLMTISNLNKDEGYFDLKNISYRNVSAGEEFHLSMYEFLFLIVRPEYAGLFEVNGDPIGAELRPKTTKSVIIGEEGVATLETKDGRFKLPTPTIHFYAKGIGRTPKTGMFSIDEKGSDGKWRIKPEFERFEALVSRTGSVRGDKRLVKKEKVKSLEKAAMNKTDTVAANHPVNTNENLGRSDISLAAIALKKFLYTSPIHRQRLKDNDELVSQGISLIKEMEGAQRLTLGSKSGTLHFVNRLYFVHFFGGRFVGLRLLSDIDIKVPVISIKKDDKTDINPDHDVTYRSIEAGEAFDLNLYEAMYLISQDEYAGYFEAFGDPSGAYLVPNFNSYLEGQGRIPSPVIEFSNREALKGKRINISSTSSGVTKIYPEFEYRFGELLVLI